MKQTYTYEGEPIGTTTEVEITPIWKISGGQDGAIFGDYMFRFGSKGDCTVYSMTTHEKISAFTLDKIEQLKVHSNAVCFGKESYAAGDAFPLLYSNVYNSYSSASDRREGVCGVYRIVRSGDSFRGELVQVIRIGFTENTNYWKSGTDDVRPYGNFVVDTDNDRLYAFTMRDKEKVTRIFSFDLPKATDGVADETYGCPVLTLEIADIRDQFDVTYSNYVQGACYLDGRIYSLEGFDSSVHAPARMQVFDLRAKKTVAVLDFQKWGMVHEPEFVSVYDGTIFYGDAKGNLFTIAFR